MKLLRLLPVFVFAITASLHAQTTRTWETYAPKDLPEGKNLYIEEVAELVGSKVTERIYVIGQFTVTASGQNRCVMRAEVPSRIRLVVEYPDGIKPPAEEEKVSRGNANPFLVTDVRKSADGQVAVYVREIVRE